MTPPNNTLAKVLGGSRHLLFDFDGPICSIFAGLPARSVAAHLRETLSGNGIDLPAAVQSADDPFDVLRFAATISDDLGERLESELRTMEMRAIQSAHPTAYAREVIEAAHNAGRALAAVSNNSRQAVTGYLTTAALVPFFDVIVGRSDPDPRLLKPHPHLIIQAVKELGGAPADCVLIGDSVSDIEGACNAGTHSIGYANKPGKLERLTKAGADIVITRMAELIPLLDEQQPRADRTAAKDLQPDR
jgi:phosphoglycolate phosphatase